MRATIISLVVTVAALASAQCVITQIADGQLQAPVTITCSSTSGVPVSQPVVTATANVTTSGAAASLPPSSPALYSNATTSVASSGSTTLTSSVNSSTVSKTSAAAVSSAGAGVMEVGGAMAGVAALVALFA